MSRAYPINGDCSLVGQWRVPGPTTRSRLRREQQRAAVSGRRVFEERDRPSMLDTEPRQVLEEPATPRRPEPSPWRGWESITRGGRETSDVGRVAGSRPAEGRHLFRQPKRLHRYCPTCGRITVETTRCFGTFEKLPPDDTESACWLCRDDVFVGSTNTEAVDALAAIADAL